ncbi:hypothetical protein UFOVP1608_43 [uncultured Caudovirales phage]|uniref:Uncharacterized protein n=1 Tax=uncultured Caudovirales phage TaxID=2100421 RepID=A0A6J5STL2_9CAUD|nr:hypothetical protein UFOVP1608_43 [uncultured Caudovirales phage]
MPTMTLEMHLADQRTALLTKLRDEVEGVMKGISQEIEVINTKVREEYKDAYNALTPKQEEMFMYWKQDVIEQCAELFTKSEVLALLEKAGE